jgi:hypothetical protein
MKKLALTIIALHLTILLCMAQGKIELFKTGSTRADLTGSNTLTEDQEKNAEVKGIDYGISLGFNRTTDKLYDANISPIDTTLVLQSLPQTSFVLSTTISYPLFGKKMGYGHYYQKVDKNGNKVDDPYFSPRGLCLVATVNLATFNSAVGGAGLFNQKLDGGIGLGWYLGDNVQIALTYEMISYLQPRDYIRKLEGKQIIGHGEKLTSLPTNNTDYFINRYQQSFAFKIIYLLSNN